MMNTIIVIVNVFLVLRCPVRPVLCRAVSHRIVSYRTVPHRIPVASSFVIVSSPGGKPI